ncbi:lipoxygenase [Nemania sp. FL0916]|nr:lipoxygenase [Nemania sp. FL0916]
MVTTVLSSTSGEDERRVLDPALPLLPSHLNNTLGPKSILTLPARSQFLSSIVSNPDNAPIQNIDPGVFNVEILRQRLYLQAPTGSLPIGQGAHLVTERDWAGGRVEVGTYEGTQAAVTQVYDRLEGAYGSFLDALGIESTLPRYVELEEQQKNYIFSSYPLNDDGQPAEYPPHLRIIPDGPDKMSIWKIFNNLGLAEAGIIIKKILPDEFLGKTKEWLLKKAREAVDGTPEQGVTIQDVVDYNELHRKSGTDIAKGENIGLQDDWFSDRRFAEQSFSGTNPVTIEKPSDALVEEFIEAAREAGDNHWATLLPKIKESLLVQDYSYFRKAIGVDPTHIMKHKEDGADECWSVASVALYQLHDNGKLHPIAITIDYKQSMKDSVTIFNKRKNPSDSTDGEKEDWPWRYAKTCALSADWIRHELTIHLGDAHLIEEAIIVATNRTIPMDHVVYRLLSPHWYKTLSLNAAARSVLVPQVIQDIIGFKPEHTSNFVKNAYEAFDFVGNYVPAQLERRGFPSDPHKLKDKRYKNYPYAKDMTAMWLVLREYVRDMLLAEWTEGEEQVNERIKADKYISDWCKEVQTAAWIRSFPTITNLDELVDAITMAIHIAAPYHTAVNYLQNYYQAFVAAKPSSLCAEPPTTLAQLKTYKEPDLVAALPLNRQRQWLLASHIPWLLSFKVASDRSLLHFALSQYAVYKYKTEKEEKKIKDATKKFYVALTGLQKYFYDVAKEMDEGSIPYMVLDPDTTAVSILI